MAGGEQRTKVEERGCQEQSDPSFRLVPAHRGLLCSCCFPEHLLLKALTSCTLAATFLLHSFLIFPCFYCAIHFLRYRILFILLVFQPCFPPRPPS